MPRFTAEVKRVKTSKSYADAQIEIVLLIDQAHITRDTKQVIKDLTDASLQEDNWIELEYKK